METTELFAAVNSQLNKAAEIVGGKAWGADKGKPRIYMSFRKDIKVSFQFNDFPNGDESDLLGGASLSIFIEDCGQHANWYAGQSKQVVARMQKPALALAALHAGDEQLARDIMDLDEVTAEMTDGAGGHLTNGRIAEARQAIFG